MTPSKGDEQMATTTSVEKFETCYRAAIQVIVGSITKAEAKRNLSDTLGMTLRTAQTHIDGLRLMLQGTTYTQVLGLPAIRHYLTRISADYGQNEIRHAISSIRGHIEYAHTKMARNPEALTRLADEFDPGEPSTLEAIQSEFDAKVINAKSLTSRERLALISRENPKPKSRVVPSTVYDRSQYVVAETLERANGVCQSCGKTAPFTRKKDRSPYLEVHHKKQLADGGEDTLKNAIAVCQNCHREHHYGVNGKGRSGNGGTSATNHPLTRL